MIKNRRRFVLESLETRELLSAAPNPGSPNMDRSGNLNAVDSAQVIHNGNSALTSPSVSDQATTGPGVRAALVQADLAASGRGRSG